MIIRAKSPLRISFAGGGTDLPHYYEEQGGAVLSSTINRYAYVSLYPRDDAGVRMRSLDLNVEVSYAVDEDPPRDGVLELAKAVVRRMGVEVGFNLDVRCDAPPGSGLGGSSAVTSAMIGALAEYTNTVLDPYELAELNFVIERVDLGIAGGKQDQYATTFGGFNLIEFHKDRVLVNPLRIPQGILNDLEAHLLVCYLGQVRPDLGLVQKQARYYKEGRAETIAGLQALHQLAYEAKEALLKGRLRRFGELLSAAYENKKRMNPHVAEGTKAEELYQLAMHRGATGGKLLGAGGGGYLLLFCETDRQHTLRQELERHGGRFTDVAFDDHGLQTWRSTTP